MFAGGVVVVKGKEFRAVMKYHDRWAQMEMAVSGRTGSPGLLSDRKPQEKDQPRYPCLTPTDVSGSSVHGAAHVTNSSGRSTFSACPGGDGRGIRRLLLRWAGITASRRRWLSQVLWSNAARLVDSSGVLG